MYQLEHMRLNTEHIIINTYMGMDETSKQTNNKRRKNKH